MTTEILSTCADAAGGANLSIKRELEDAVDEEPPSKVMKSAAPQSAPLASSDGLTKEMEKEKAMITRKLRLEQNRKAAKESRRRKKIMIEELQRSVIFFSRANGALKQHNDELMQLLIQAQSMISPNGEQKPSAHVHDPIASNGMKDSMEQVEAEAVATQALYASQGFSAAAAREVAQTMKGTGSKIGNVDSAIPDVQTGATMQAMASFQQAATAAMEAAMQGISHAIPGLNMSQLAATPVGANAQQAYTDAMTAMAMQQAATTTAGQQLGMQSFMMNPMFAWQHAFSTSGAEEERTIEL
ncbi:hypothetical protein FisN_12Lh331 [Fistulifera solaris]|uniref:BZIP domain-containing protein n=1 Tax=Fistulifera solaris TaxID=1519565 RepID=A0A1Z5JLT2_FISSO|nr:hypothetical protein FisN_12Lh331 [Fistulifera solaris]|eukprot:GAX14970.1 hypothetical protein FisN_12Lh331 [Fistulifera solaris]